MTNKPENPPAFAAIGGVCRADSFGQEGMTLRDYFAGQALQGFCSNPEWVKNARELKVKPADNQENHAIAAYQMADAMLKERKE